MNRYLLDTHILLWWLSNDKNLSKSTKALITKPTNHITVSVASIWEIVIKKSIGKLIVPDNLKELLYENDFEILSITAAHALYLEHLPSLHHDPFYRILIAQSIVEDFVFITNDKTILQYNVKSI